MIGDPFAAIGNLILGVYKEGKVQAWIRLIFMLSVSSISSFLTICGGALIAGSRTSLAIGMGMVSASVSLVVILRASPLTKGMLFVLPGQEAKDEINSDLQIIQRDK